MAQPGTILIVDDEQAVRLMLEAALRTQGSHVRRVASGEEALALLGEEDFDVLLLDLRLGGLDGLDVLRVAKERAPSTEVILLTAHSSVSSAVTALRHGAFDYLLKPVQVAEIRDRVERGLERRRDNAQRSALIGRIFDSARSLGMLDSHTAPDQPAPSPDQIHVGPLILDMRRHNASLDSQPLPLTRTEFALLTALAQTPDTALSYAELSEAIYGRPQPEDEARALLRPHIARLRQKLETGRAVGIVLVSIRSMGYMLSLSGERKSDEQ
ncbi:MAG: response regulator transcription factor [Chloroflexales bacterium]|nr:response regulator transcription factor [Chloroflexales bacterium]